MERSNYFDDQYVLPEDLNNTESTKINQIRLRTLAPLNTSGGIGKAYTFWSGSVAGGVFGAPSAYQNNSINLFPNKVTTTQIDIAPGKAIDPVGNLVVVSTVQNLVYGTSTSIYTWPTGSISSLNYIRIKYQETSSSIKSTTLGVSFPTRYTGSYYITVNNNIPASEEILLGTFYSDSLGKVTGSIQDRRQYVRVVTAADGVYTFDETLSTAQVHVEATGSGTPSATNPHGWTAGDIDAAVNNQNIILVPQSGSIVLNQVYQNPSASTMYLSTVVELEDKKFLLSNSLRLLISTTGSIGGSLGGDIYEVAERELKLICVTESDEYTWRGSLSSFIPSNWFYKIAFPDSTSDGSGSIISAVQYW